jgi:hypothetical protein
VKLPFSEIDMAYLTLGPSTIMMPFLGRDLRQLRIGCGIWILIGDRPMGDGLNLWVVEVWKVTK